MDTDIARLRVPRRVSVPVTVSWLNCVAARAGHLDSLPGLYDRSTSRIHCQRI